MIKDSQLTSSPTDNVIKGAFFALATSFVMSGAAAMIKHTATMVPIEIIVAAQYIICVLFMLPWLLRKGVKALHTDNMKLHIIRAICGWACFYTYYLAINHIPLVDATLLRNAAPLCVPFYVYFVYSKRISAIRWIPLAIGFAGVGLILKPQSEGMSYWHLVGFASAITLAGSIITTRMLTRTESTNCILFYYFLISAIASIPLALLSLPISSFLSIPIEALVFMLLIAFSILVTMWLYTRAYVFAKASIISPISYAGVVFAGFWGWLYWNQIPDWLSIAGVLLVAAGGVGSVILGAREDKLEALAKTEKA